MADVTRNDRDVTALRARFRRTERLVATLVVLVVASSLAVSVFFSVVTGRTIDAHFVTLALGGGLICGDLVFVIRNAGDELPWAHDEAAVPAKPIRRAALSGDASGMNEAQVAAATRWAAQQSVHLRASVVSSLLMFGGLAGVLVGSRLPDQVTEPFVWGFVALLGALLFLCVPLTIRQRRLTRFAARMGARDSPAATALR